MRWSDLARVADSNSDSGSHGYFGILSDNFQSRISSTHVDPSRAVFCDTTPANSKHDLVFLHLFLLFLSPGDMVSDPLVGSGLTPLLIFLACMM